MDTKESPNKEKTENNPKEDTDNEKKSNMDKANKKALNVLVKDGEKAFVEHVFTDQNNGERLSYAEMRSRFG
jgi:hypothetical protein